MHPRIQEVLDHLDRHRAGLAAAIASVAPSAYTRRPAADSWSVAEVVEHLGLVETRLAGVFADRLADARTRGLGPETDSTPVLPTLDDAALLDRGRPLAAGEAVQPRAGLSVPEAWSVLERARAQLRQTVAAADGLALGEVYSPHPRLGSLNLYQWLIFIGSHEGRHAAQIREIASRLSA